MAPRRLRVWPPPAPLVLACVASVTGAFLVARTFAYFSSGTGRHRAETAALWLAAVALLGGALQLRGGGAREITSARMRGTGAFVIVVAALLLYWPALGVGLLSDDFVLLPSGRLCGYQAWQFLRPLPLGLWRLLDGALPHAAVPIVLHALNIVLHATNGLLVYRIGGVLGLTGGPALFAALAFVCFPANVEAVVWASGIQDVLLTTGTLVFVLGLASGRAAHAAAGLVVALASKETAIAAPFLAFVLLATPRNHRVLLPRVAAAAAVCLAYAAWRLWAAESVAPLSVSGGYGAKELVTRPFATLVLPWTSGELRARPLVAAVIAGALAATIAVFLARERSPFAHVVLRSAGWVVLAVLPVGGMLYVSPELEGSRYLYLPLVGFSTGLAALGAGSRRPVASALAAAVLVCYAVSVREHIAPWIQAAAARDRVLAAVRERLDEAGGGNVAIDYPETVSGAFVFRNGLREAVARDLGCDAAGRVQLSR